MKVSVIIVNYNGKEFIGECLDSVLASSYKDFEIIVVDNGSTDNSVKFIKESTGSRVKLIESPKNLYFTGGCNLGAKNAKGDFLFFLNSDAIIDQSCLRELVNFVKGHPNYLVQPKILFYQEKKSIDNVGGHYFFGFGFAVGRGEKDKGQYDKNKQYDYVNGTAFMTARDFFWQLGGFDERFRYFYEDVDLSLRAKDFEGECWSCPPAVVYHQGSLTFKKALSKKGLHYYYFRNRNLLRFKRLNQKIKSLINRLRLWELKNYLGKKRLSLLDLGCGDGTYVRTANQLGIKAIGVEPKTTALHSMVVIKSSIEKLTLKKKFDVVTMYHVLEHVNNPKKVLIKAKENLKDEGILVLEVPLVGNFTEKFLGKDFFAYGDKTHKHFFTKRQLVQLLNETGFEVIKKGNVLYEFPLTAITTGFRKSFLHGLVGLFLFLPLKMAALAGLNDEIIRFYCSKKSKN